VPRSPCRLSLVLISGYQWVKVTNTANGESTYGKTRDSCPGTLSSKPRSLAYNSHGNTRLQFWRFGYVTVHFLAPRWPAHPGKRYTQTCPPPCSRKSVVSIPASYPLSGVSSPRGGPPSFFFLLHAKGSFHPIYPVLDDARRQCYWPGTPSRRLGVLP